MKTSSVTIALLAGQLCFVGIVALWVRAWFRRQPDPLAARYRLSTVTIILLALLVAASLIADFAFPGRFSSGTGTMAVMPLILLALALVIHRAIRRKLRARDRRIR